jgi:hypothetical protein
MAFTPSTVALLRKIRREQGRPLRVNAADIGIHCDREVTADEQAEILAKMVNSDNVRQRDRGVIGTWLAENTDVPDVFDAAEKLIKAQGDAGLWTLLESDVRRLGTSQ